MSLLRLIQTAALYSGVFLLLAGCQALPQSEQLKRSAPAGVAAKFEIQNVPFFPQKDFYCGPTTLAEVFNFYGHQVTPDSIAPTIFIPQREGSLQIEMVSTARMHGFVPYAAKSDLTTIIQLVAENKPVIVLQNLALPWYPMWHYAVVKGYDLQHAELTLHTGVTENYKVSFELFERTWQRGKYWMLVPLIPGQTSQFLEPFEFINAAYNMLLIGKTQSAIKSLESATKQWPDEWLSYFLIGTHFIDSAPSLAASWFEQGFENGKSEPNYLNNYAYTLAQIGCMKKAHQVIALARALSPQDDNILDTLLSINSVPEKDSATDCEVQAVSDQTL